MQVWTEWWQLWGASGILRSQLFSDFSLLIIGKNSDEGKGEILEASRMLESMIMCKEYGSPFGEGLNQSVSWQMEKSRLNKSNKWINDCVLKPFCHSSRKSWLLETSHLFTALCILRMGLRVNESVSYSLYKAVKKQELPQVADDVETWWSPTLPLCCPRD